MKQANRMEQRDAGFRRINVTEPAFVITLLSASAIALTLAAAARFSISTRGLIPQEGTVSVSRQQHVRQSNISPSQSSVSSVSSATAPIDFSPGQAFHPASPEISQLLSAVGLKRTNNLQVNKFAAERNKRFIQTLVGDPVVGFHRSPTIENSSSRLGQTALQFKQRNLISD